MKTAFFTDLPAIVSEQGKLADVNRKGFWRTETYETAEITGTLLCAHTDNYPEPLTLLPRLHGWYRIYVGVAALINQAGSNVVNIKLDTDDSYTQLRPHVDVEGGGVEEVFWKCADLTDRTLTLGKLPASAIEENTILGWLRFEEMTQAEIDAFHTEQADASHRHIYATHDMHYLAYQYTAQSEELWKLVTQQFEQSDVEWLSMENIFSNQPKLPVPQEEYSFNRLGDANVHKILGKPCSADFYPRLIAHAHRLGIKAAVSYRMGQWSIPFPFDNLYTHQFWRDHPEYRCIDRDGVVLPMLSYAFDGVQDYVIGELLTRAKDGFDAVDLLFHRGIPYVLFEKPFCDQFAAVYGDAIDPRTLPQTDSRLQAVRCTVLTGFIAKLRRALNDAGLAKVRIHIRCMHAVRDNLMLGIDPLTLAKEKLVDAFIPHPVFARETMRGDNIWADDAHTQLDIAEYTKQAMRPESSLIWRHEGFANRDSVASIFESIGETPITETECLAEWVDLQNTCGVQVYFEIMPRQLTAQTYRERILEIADAGGIGFSMWDTYGRVCVRNTWHLLRHGTHFDWVRAQQPGPDGYCKRYRFQKIGDIFVGRYRPNWSI